MSKMQFVGKTGQADGEMMRRTPAISQHHCDTPICEPAVTRPSDIGRKMRRQRRAAKQANGVTRLCEQSLQQLRLGTIALGRDFNKHDRPEPTVFNAQGIKLVMAANHYDRYHRVASPAQNSTDPLGAAGETGRVKDYQIDARLSALKRSLEPDCGCTGVNQQHPAAPIPRKRDFADQTVKFDPL
jgi:hypothetical protein